MTHTEIAAEWAAQGDLARAASFMVAPDILRKKQCFIADLEGVGKDAVMSIRVFRELDADAMKEQIIGALAAMYAELVQAHMRVPSFQNRRFEK